jgi:hypothetical protein
MRRYSMGTPSRVVDHQSPQLYRLHVFQVAASRSTARPPSAK